MAILYRIAPECESINACIMIFTPDYPAFKGRHVRCGMRQSMPSSSIASCADVRQTLPSLAAGQTNRPRSGRLENRQAPWLSHQIILSKSPRRPRNTNRWPENILCQNLLGCRQSIETPPHVCHARRQPDPCVAWHGDHEESPFNKRANISASKPPSAIIR